MDKQYYWLYFDRYMRCVKFHKDNNAMLPPLMVLMLSQQGFSRQLGLLSADFNPVGKNKEELLEFLC